MVAFFIPKCRERLSPFTVTAAAISWILDGPGPVISALCTLSPSIFKQPSKMTVLELPLQNRLEGEVASRPGTPAASGRAGAGNWTFAEARPPQVLGAGLCVQAQCFASGSGSSSPVYLSGYLQPLKSDIYLIVSPFWHLIFF